MLFLEMSAGIKSLPGPLLDFKCSINCLIPLMDTNGQWANLSKIIMDSSGVLASVPLSKHIETGSTR